MNKKIVALLISILIVAGIVAAVYFINQNKSNNSITQNNNAKEKITMSEGKDGLILIKGGTFEMGSPESEPVTC